jgi:phosphoribosylformylglycinamidine cyclo-ligase
VVHGLANITGGAFTKLLRLKKTGFVLDSMPTPPKIMQLIESMGVSNEEMHKTFNMGVGFCIIAPKDESDRIMSICKKHRLESYQIGYITQRTGVFLNDKRLA